MEEEFNNFVKAICNHDIHFSHDLFNSEYTIELLIMLMTPQICSVFKTIYNNEPEFVEKIKFFCQNHGTIDTDINTNRLLLLNYLTITFPYLTNYPDITTYFKAFYEQWEDATPLPTQPLIEVSNIELSDMRTIIINNSEPENIKIFLQNVVDVINETITMEQGVENVSNLLNNN